MRRVLRGIDEYPRRGYDRSRLFGDLASLDKYREKDMRHLSLESYNDLVGTIYEAGTDPSKWQAVLDKLDKILDSAYLSIYGHDTRSDLFLGTLSTKYPDCFLEDYARYYCKTNLFLPVLMRAPLMEARFSEAWVPKDNLIESEFYNDWLRPQEDIGSGGGGVLFNEDGRLLIFSGQVRFSEEETKTPQLIDTINLLAPHVRRAFAIQRLLQGQRVQDVHYRKVLDNVSNAVFLIDRRGRIAHHNRAAEEVLKKRSLFYLDPWKTLRAFDSGADSAISGALTAINAERYETLRSAIRLPEKNKSQIHVATLVPFKPDHDLTGIFADFIAEAIPIAMLTVVDPGARRDPLQDALAVLYGLTATEAVLANRIFAGDDVKSYAEARGISVHTARSQLKSIFAKTGTHKQSELAALVSRFSGI